MMLRLTLVDITVLKIYIFLRFFKIFLNIILRNIRRSQIINRSDWLKLLNYYSK